MPRDATEAEKMIFGHNVQIGPDDKPIEQGFGSVARKTEALASTEAHGEKRAKDHQAMLADRAAEELRKAEASASAKKIEETANKLNETLKGFGQKVLDKIEDDF